MTTIRYARNSRDNKIRAFNRAGSCNDILPSANYKRRINPVSPNELFTTTGKKRNNTQNENFLGKMDKVDQTFIGSFEKPTEDENNKSAKNKGVRNGDKVMNVLEGKNRSETCSYSVVSGTHLEDKAMISAAHPMAPSGFKEVASNSSFGDKFPMSDGCCDVSCYSRKNSMEEKEKDEGGHSSPEHLLDTTANCDTCLCDVNDEELGQLPDLDSSCRNLTGKYKNSFYPFFKQTGVSGFEKINDKMPKLKRSLSSIESDEDFTSFFGSIRSGGRRLNGDDSEEGNLEQPLYFNAYSSKTAWHSGSPPMLGANLNRAYSAESFMRKKDLDESRSGMNSRRSSSYYGEEFEKAHLKSSKDRLQMRRGALAEPEKMLISQEVRERAEKDVEKRKTSLIRKVSQFFNVHLRLNREEDLI